MLNEIKEGNMLEFILKHFTEEQRENLYEEIHKSKWLCTDSWNISLLKVIPFWCGNGYEWKLDYDDDSCVPIHYREESNKEWEEWYYEASHRINKLFFEIYRG